MESRSISKNGRSLLDYVLSRLRPEIFTHTVWINFGNKEKLVSPGTVANLFCAAEQLQDSDPDSACQVLLLCAAYQNYAGQRDEALKTLQKILSLAERNRLAREVIWATWGACAVCVQDGYYEQAARHLLHLQSILQEGNDWVLVDFIEMVKQTLVQKDAVRGNGEAKPSSDPPCTGLMDIIFTWLQHWGFAAQLNLPEFCIVPGTEHDSPQQETPSPQPLFSAQRWRGYWHTFNQVLRGELRLSWVSQDGHPRGNPDSHQPGQDHVSPGLKQIPASLFPPVPFHTQVQSPVKTEVSPVMEEKGAKASLLVYCLGSFQVYKNDLMIDKWSGNKCRQIMKYLVVHFNSPVNQEVLMELFWPEIDTRSARRNLYQAIYNLRQALQNGDDNYAYILTEGNNYRLNPDMDIWMDSESFNQHYQAAQKLLSLGLLAEAVREFEIAENLYQGEFLAEDRYEDWPLVQRENLKNAYLNVLDQLGQYFYANGQFALSLHYCHKILGEDNCREDAHRRVMMCYMNLDQPHLALRQYQICVEALRQELDVPPMPATEELHKQIQQKRQK